MKEIQVLRLVLYDASGTFEEELAKQSLKLKDMKNEEQFEDPVTPEKSRQSLLDHCY